MQELPVVHLRLDLGGQVTHARQLVHQPGQPAHSLHLAQLVAKVREVEALAGLELGGNLRRLVPVDLALHLLDESQHVAHAEDARGDAVRVEGLEGRGLLAGTDELDGLAGDVAHRERGAAARVAVRLGEDHPGERQCVVKGLRRPGGVLTAHSVHHEQRLHRLHGGVDAADLLHHPLVHVQPPRAVQEHHVQHPAPGVVHRTGGDRDGVLTAVRGVELRAHLAGKDGELLDGGRAVDVRARHHHALLALLQPAGELRHRGGLARALQSRHQDDDRRPRPQVQPLPRLAHHRDQLVTHDADELLARREALHDLLPERAQAHPLDELLHHGKRDVRLEERHADLAQGVADVVLGEAPLAPQVLQRAGQALGQAFEHVGFPFNTGGLLCHDDPAPPPRTTTPCYPSYSV